jgi:CheY-like chemotaxis protein
MRRSSEEIAVSTSSSNHRPVVLLVEDEPIVREIVALELQEIGFDVISVPNGEDAARLLNEAPIIDLVFTDVNLPGAIDGWEVARLARLRRADLPVIYATGSFEDDTRGVAGSIFMSKPYRTAHLAAAADALGVARG